MLDPTGPVSDSRFQGDKKQNKKKMQTYTKYVVCVCLVDSLRLNFSRRWR